MEKSKTSRDSYTEQVQVLTQSTMNGNNRLFGGHLMEWIDLVAVVVGRRHSNRNVTTVLVEELEFKAPAYANELVVLAGQIVYTGTTSMVVRVNTFTEELDGARRVINTAYLTLVALDADDKPCPVPRLVTETEEERAEYEAARARSEQRKVQRRLREREEKNGLS